MPGTKIFAGVISQCRRFVGLARLHRYDMQGANLKTRHVDSLPESATSHLQGIASSSRPTACTRFCEFSTFFPPIPAIEQLVGNTIERLHADAGYRGHNAPPDYKFKIYTSKQKRRVTPQVKREMRRRAAVEPVIGHLKEDHRMDRNYLAHRHGDLNNAVLAAAGYNFRRLIRWLRILLRLFLAALFATPNTRAT